MIVGTGIDLVDIRRIERAIARHGDRFLMRVFTAEEIASCRGGKTRSQYFAARFAAKEAAVKALGTGFTASIGMRDISITSETSGRPVLSFTGGALSAAEAIGVSNVHLSLTHSLASAAAVVVLESRE